jgi:hypothetical protein
MKPAVSFIQPGLNGSQAYGCEQILNCFADYFQSVYNNPVSNNNNTPLASAGQNVNVNITDITEEEILDALLKP